MGKTAISNRQLHSVLINVQGLSGLLSPLQSYEEEAVNSSSPLPPSHSLPLCCCGQHPVLKCHPGAHALAPLLASVLRAWAGHSSHPYSRLRDRLDTCVPKSAVLHSGSWVHAPPQHSSLNEDKPGLCFSMVSGQGSMRHREDAVFQITQVFKHLQ